MNNRITRLVIGIIIPPFIGAILVFMQVIIMDSLLPLDNLTNKETLNFFIFLVAISYAFMGLPSILYTFIMEFYINKKIKNDFVTIMLSIIIGGLSGLFIQLMTIGTLTGFIVGIVLRIMYLKDKINFCNLSD